MDANAVLDRLTALGVTVRAEGGMVLLQPGSKVPLELKDAVREHKPQILAQLRRAMRPLGDGQTPPLGRPPKTEQELRRLVDHLADPEAFTRWLDWAMTYTDSAEGSEKCP